MTVWYDFTTTLRADHRNGIANVEWSVGTALLDADPTARLFAMPAGKLVEIDRAALAATVYARTDVATARVVVGAEQPTWRSAVRGGLRAALGARATPLIRRISAVYQGSRRVRGRLAGRPLPASTGAELSGLVQAGDWVVSLGADWDGTLAGRLGRLRQATGCRVATMIYDLIPLTHTHLAFHKEPELFAAYYTRLLGVSDLITCISEQSRQDLLGFAAARGLQAPPTRVLTLGETLSPDAERLLAEPPAREPFFLWVGTLERRKNLGLLYDALRIIEGDGGVPPVIVAVGSTGWGVGDLLDELDTADTEAARALVRLGGVDDVTLDHLYARARALVYPSLYEGWGLPVREAAVRGLPVAAGDSPAVREAMGSYPGGALLPIDDPGPWADYLRSRPRPAEPSPVRPWADTVRDLLAYLAEVASAVVLGGGDPVRARGRR